MRTDRQRTNLLVDVGLYVGLVLATLLDVTGVPVHEWLGAAVVVASGYHLLVHRRWVATVAARFLAQTSGQARRFFLVDAAVMLGFLSIGVTGLAVSTWLELPLASYPLWRDLHVYVSVATLGLVVLKVGLHWRWIVTIGRRAVAGLASSPAAPSTPITPRNGGTRLGRREFARLMVGIAGTAAYASWAALDPFGQSAAEATDARPASASPAAMPTASGLPRLAASAATTSPTATASTASRSAGNASSVASATSQATTVPTRTAVATRTTLPTRTTVPTATATPVAVQQCTVRCSKGCAYPGRCRKYVDANRNGRCDLGECL